MAETVFVCLLALGATVRLTRLWVQDAITAPLRDKISNRARLHPKCRRRPLSAFLADLQGCQWCASMWVAAAVAPTAYFHGTTPWFVIGASILTLSHLTGLAATWLDPDDHETHKVIHHIPGEIQIRHTGDVAEPISRALITARD